MTTFRTIVFILSLITAAGSALAGPVAQRPTQEDDEAAQLLRREASEVVARTLAHRDPLVRQRAAEELARRVAADQRKLIEGYRLQEKDARVKVALDWALYRTGKTEALFPVVSALDSARANQSMAYLMELEGPDLLYKFFPQVNRTVQIKLFEVLAKLGDAESLKQIQPYTESPNREIAAAAQFAQREINLRLSASPSPAPMRRRQVGKGNQDPPAEDEVNRL